MSTLSLKQGLGLRERWEGRCLVGNGLRLPSQLSVPVKLPSAPGHCPYLPACCDRGDQGTISETLSALTCCESRESPGSWAPLGLGARQSAGAEVLAVTLHPTSPPPGPTQSPLVYPRTQVKYRLLLESLPTSQDTSSHLCVSPCIWSNHKCSVYTFSQGS